MAVSSVELKAILSLQSDIGPKLASIEQALGRLGATSKSTGASFGTLAGSMTVGTLAANAISGAISNTVGAFLSAGKGALDLSSRLEQARIGFTTMLGSAQKADQFIGQLQTKAESTAFSFPGLQQVAQSFLAMGISANNVIPIIDDVSNALSAAGHGGDTDALQRVGQSLAEIAAQGKVTGEQLRELSRNGIAVLPLLADAFGKTTAEVRKMAEQGEISANMFFEAFHSQVAQRYGDIQAQQARTWAVAVSNLGDILGRISTDTLKEFFEALTRGALALNDFLHSDRVLQWAADFKASIHEVLVALEPLLAAIGIGPAGPAPPPLAKPAPPTSAQARDDWRIPPEAIKSAKDYADQVKAAEAAIHADTQALTELSAQQDALKNKIGDVTKTWDLRLTGLKDQQAANNAAIEATKTKYEALLDPLQRQSSALQRLGEDTKATFAKILDPLKAQLDGVNSKIADTKTAYEAATRPIQAQIDAINRANNALKAQRDLVVKIADISLREKQLASLGDPALRASIASQMKTLEIADEYLQIQKDQLDLGNKKGSNDKAIASVQSQLDANRSKELALQKQLLDAADKPLQAQIAGQEVLNSAQAEALKIAQDKADLEAAAKTRPLEEQLAAAKAQLQTLLDPLEAQATALEKMIKSVSATEAAALAPIEAAQTSVARAIADTTQAMQDALKPLEDASKAIAAQITAAEAGKAAALAPLKQELDDLDRKSNALDLHKRQQADIVQGAKDAAAAMKDEAAQAAKVATALDLSGGKGADFPVLPGGLEGPVAPKVGKSLIPPETIANIRAFSAALGEMNVQLETMSANGDLTKLSNAVLLLGTVFVGSRIVATLTAVSLGLISIIPWVGGVVDGFGMIAGAAGSVGTALAGVGAATIAVGVIIVAFIAALAAYATNFNGFRDTVNAAFTNIKDTVGKVFTDMGDNIKKAVDLMLKDSREGGSNPFPQMVAWFNSFPSQVGAAKDSVVGVFTGMGANIKGATDLMLKATSQGGSNPFPDLQAAFEGFKTLIDPTVAGIVKVFEPLAAVLKTIGDAIITMPKDMPGWLGGLIALIRGGGGGGTLRTSYNPQQSGGWSDIPPSMRTGGGGDLSGNTLLQYVKDTFTASMGEEAGRVAAAIALTEGGLNGARGDNGQSAGVFQFYGGGGQLNNFAAYLNTSLEEAANIATQRPDLAVQYALRGYLGAAIQAGLDAGLSGPELATYAQRYGQVSVSPERAGQSYNSLFGAGGSMPTTTVDLSGGVSGQQGNRLLSYTPSPAWDPKMADAQADAEKALADAQANLNQIMAGAPAINNAAAASTTANATAQKAAVTWAQQMDAQQAALNATLAQQVPPGRAAADAMTQLGSVLGPVERQIAAGSISADTLRGTLLDLAKATGLADQPWQDFASGAADANAAMDELIGITATLGPEFQAVADYQKTAGSSSNEAALRWFQAAKAYAAAKDALAAAPAVPPVPTATANSVDVVGANWVEVKAKQDAAAESLRGYQTVVQGLDPGKIQEQSKAWDDTTGAVDKLSEGLHKLANFLDDHTFHVQVKVDDIPDWATPGSPTPFQRGLEGIKRAADDLKPISLLSGNQPLLSPASRSAAFAGGGGGGISVGEIHVNGGTDPVATARAVRDELVKLGRRNGGGSRVLS